PETVALEDRRRRMHRAEAHLRRIEAGPLRIEDAADRLKVVFAQRFLRRQDQPGGAVGDLRAVAGGDVAVLAVEEGLQLGERLRRRIAPDAVVQRVGLAIAVVECLDLAAARRKMAGSLRRRDALV